MTSRERLMATLRGEPVDRPAVNFYEIGGFDIDPADPDEFNVYHDPSWRPLLELAEQRTDLIRMRSAVRSRSWDPQTASPNCGSRMADCGLASPVESEITPILAPDDLVRIHPYVEGPWHCIRTTMQIGGRLLSSTTRRSPEVDTIWTTEHLLKNTDDLKAYLELPEEFFAEEIDVARLIEDDAKVGERGIVMVDTEDPLCAAASLFGMEDFLTVALTEPALFHRLLEKLARPLYARTARVAEAFPGHLWRIYGPEYAAEPFLPPRLFQEYVVRYTEPMVRVIRQHGGFARVHCHGRIHYILDLICEMGADGTDPIEPPPHGDVRLDYVRREYGDRLVLFGNIELSDIESREPPAFERLVQQTLADGTRGQGRGFVLMPSAAPNGRQITPRILKNYETMVHLAEACRF
jgi:uroporphyrinogen-III decarboxylase